MPGGGEARVIAWLWARTVPCPNPACGAQMPLMTTFQLSTKANNLHWTRPVVNRQTNTVSFHVQDHTDGLDKERTIIRGGKGVVCITCNSTAPHSYIREQSKSGNMGEQMTTIVAEGDRNRLFLSPTAKHIRIAASARPNWRPTSALPKQALGFSIQRYGLTHWHNLFTERQLVALTTFNDLLSETKARLTQDMADTEYANAVITYLALAISKLADSNSSFSTYHLPRENVRNVFARQAIPMVWDFAEGNPFADAAGTWNLVLDKVAKVLEYLPNEANCGTIHQADASTTIHANDGPVVVTDPPYYDNIGYADLSDFFYVWMRPMLREIYPGLFAGMLVPKEEEMIAAPRFEDAKERFEDLMGKTLQLVRERCSPEFPSSIFYAYKQQEDQRGGKTSTGWETILTALVKAGFQIIRTWPMRTEKAGRSRQIGSNALASSVILVCRPRPEDAPAAARRQFLNELENYLPDALDHLTREGHIAPVDLAQAAIGPGMEIYSKYSRVETISGEPVPVRDALIEINRVIAEYHRREQGELDSRSQFCLDWLREYAYGDGRYGQAELLAQAKNVSVESMTHLLTADSGVVKLLPPSEYRSNPQLTLGDMTAWEGCFRMAYHLDVKREDGEGISGAAKVAQAMGSDADSVERLARILYDHYDAKNDSQNAVMFNNLVTSWQDILAAMQAQSEQATFF